MGKKISIIGAGIAGLSAGCYLQMNGYETEIFELHSLPGGLCTGWNRRDYYFDTCIHWLVGSHPKDPLYKFWNEIVDMKKLEFVYFDKYMTFMEDGQSDINLYADLYQMKNELLRIAPEDSPAINELVKAVEKILKFKLYEDKAPELHNIWDKLKFLFNALPYLGILQKYVKITSTEYSQRFSNPRLRFLMENLFYPEMAAIFSLFVFRWFHEKTSGYPVGGSLNFANQFEKRCLELGGKIHYRAKVKKIVVENGKTKGITLQNGEFHPSDIVISAADGHSTIFEMLEGKYLTDELKNYYENHLVFCSYLQVSIGLKREFAGDSSMITLKLNESFRIDPETETNSVGIRIYSFDKSSAPEGKTVVSVLFSTYNFKYWQDLRKSDYGKYLEEKQRLADFAIDVLEKKFGNIKDNIEELDISTPATVIRYTNNWKGSFEGWVMTPKIGFSKMKRTIKGLDGFYMAGQWVEPGGGLPVALQSGRHTAQIICKKDHKKFRTIHF